MIHKSIIKSQQDILLDLEILLLHNEDDFDRGGGKYILKQYIDENKNNSTET